VVPYSNQAFRQAIIKWLVATNQPLHALEHPKFKDMIDLATRATNSVKIPGQKATQMEIKLMFKEHLTSLKAKLTGPIVTGNINLTCDTWLGFRTGMVIPTVFGLWVPQLRVRFPISATAG
ncbi:hypothetical protein V8E52_006527, partial [Russula decolorans]